MNTRQELLACVRNLPRPSGRAIAPDVWAVCQAEWRGPVLARSRNIEGNRYIYEPPTGSDLCLRYISRQKLLEFIPDNSHMMSRLNAELPGDRRYPLIAGVCGTFANVAYNAIQAAISACQATHAMQVQARVRDELWAIEVVGRQGKDLQHILYLWLVDHLRTGTPGQGGYNAWLVHEIRHDLAAPDQPCRTQRLPTSGRRMEDLIPPQVIPVRTPGAIAWGASHHAY